MMDFCLLNKKLLQFPKGATPVGVSHALPLIQSIIFKLSIHSIKSTSIKPDIFILLLCLLNVNANFELHCFRFFLIDLKWGNWLGILKSLSTSTGRVVSFSSPKPIFNSTNWKFLVQWLV